MNIKMLEIGNSLKFDCQWVRSLQGHLGSHTLNVLQAGFNAVQKNSGLAIASVIGMNILMVEILLKVVDSVMFIFDRYKKQLGEAKNPLQGIVLINGLSLCMVGMNMNLIPRMTSLNPVITGLFMTALVASYGTIRLIVHLA